jgi:hypothetical protein
MQWGVEVKWQAKRGPCYAFFKLDINTYHLKLNLKMFICVGYSGGGRPMMWISFVMDGNKQKRNWLIIKHNALKWIKANNVTTLVLGSRPRQRVARLRAKRKTQESHHMLPRMQRVWGDEPSHSQVKSHVESSKHDCKGQTHRFEKLCISLERYRNLDV